MKTERVKQLPTFYTHVIGSLPRPKAVRDLLDARGSMPADRFSALLDEKLIFAIRLQEKAGIDVISDGEWRRSQYVDEFLDRIGGFPKIRRYEHQGEVKYHRVAVRRTEPADAVFAPDARFLAKFAHHHTKFALPSPFLIAIRYWHEDYSAGAYPTYQHLMEHMAAILAREASALVDAGIDVVQIDDPALTYFCDRGLMAGEEIHDARLRRKWDVDAQFPEAVAAINQITEGLRAEVHLHCCHSVYKRRSDVSGDYKPILPRLRGVRVDRINLEFAYPRTGDITDLRYLPGNLAVGLGIVDVRSERLQSVEQMVQIATNALPLLAPERIALNPDCGFAPNTEEPPSIEEAQEKLRRLSAAAEVLRTSQRAAISVTRSPQRRDS